VKYTTLLDSCFVISYVTITLSIAKSLKTPHFHEWKFCLALKFRTHTIYKVFDDYVTIYKVFGDYVLLYSC